MVSKQKNRFNLKTWQKVVLGFVAISVALIVVMTFLSFTDTDISQSQKNIDLMTDAKKKLDINLCDQIKGGVQPPQKPKGLGLNVAVFMNSYPPMNETEAKERCKTDVQHIIDRQGQNTIY